MVGGAVASFALGVHLLAGAAVPAASLALEHLARYDTHTTYHDHLVSVERISEHHALIGSNLDLVLVDLASLPPQGTSTYLARLTALDVQSTRTRADGWVFASLRLGGFAVLFFDRDALTLARIRMVQEPGVYYGKVAIDGDRLYVPAHAHGLRIFDIANPAQPVLIGSLAEGFADAFAVAVAGDTAYVADGAGGLKIVDVSDETSPEILDGENPQSAAGGAQDVLVVNGHVYVACGAAGVAVYLDGSLSQRTLHDTPGTAKDLEQIGDYLAVADIRGLEVFRIHGDGSLSHAVAERAQRRSRGGTNVSLRLWHGVTAWGPDRVVAANWDSTDVYRLVDAATGSQPDVIAGPQRIRFAPGGGSAVVRMRSAGAGTLHVTDVHATDPTVDIAAPSTVLPTGATLDVAVDYAGGPPGAAIVFVESDDPDESPLPIEVFGETPFLDPGEPAIPFTVESWTFDHQTREFTHGTFDLATHAGQVVYFHVFGVG
jgi:hypothetical protein